MTEAEKKTKAKYAKMKEKRLVLCYYPPTYELYGKLKEKGATWCKNILQKAIGKEENF